jgi:tripartite ATP-independent transporter DctM subunit
MLTFYILLIFLALLAILGAPLFSIILAVAMLGFFISGVDLSVIAIEIYRIADTPLLLALPLFTFAGYLMGQSQTSKRLVRLTRVFIGWMPGGLAIVSLVACALFTAFTGASGVTIVALGALLYPALMQDGYRENFSLGLVTTSGSLGLLFPPSLPLILYGVIVQQMGFGQQFTIDDLFLAGLLPGLLMVILLFGKRSPDCFAGSSLGTAAAVFFNRRNLWRLCGYIRGGGGDGDVCSDS